MKSIASIVIAISLQSLSACRDAKYTYVYQCPMNCQTDSAYTKLDNCPICAMPLEKILETDSIKIIPLNKKH